MNLEDCAKGVCLDCQAEFAWARFMQGSKLCKPCEKVINPTATTKESV